MKRPRTGCTKRGAILLAELIVTVALLTGVIAVGMRAVVTARHLSERDAVMTQIYAAAQTEMARLCAADWAALAESDRALTPEEMTGLGLKIVPNWPPGTERRCHDAKSP